MAAKDKFHSIVKVALEKEQWKITDAAEGTAKPTL